MTDFVQVFTTTETKRKAQEIARHLVEQELAGCVQIVGPISSIYHWQEQVETATEWLCIIKSSQARYPDLEAAIRQVHPYQVPEILAMPVTAGGQDYLAWLAKNLAGD